MSRRHLFCLLALVLTGCQFEAPSTPPVSGEISSRSASAELQKGLITLKSPLGNTIEILAEIADEPEAQQYGLMGRTRLAESEGMLFIFPGNQSLSFWMKDTLIPLDILFFDASGAFVSGATMTPCRGDPCPVTPSQKPAKFALELHSDFIVKQGVGEGWRLEGIR